MQQMHGIPRDRDLLSEILERVRGLEQKVQPIKPIWANDETIQILFGLTQNQLKTLRLDGSFAEGIHYVRINNKSVLYAVPVVENFIANRLDPKAHQGFCELWLKKIAKKNGIPS